jgi:citrate/tricarballylate utilization protein
MPAIDLQRRAEHALTVCNSCRYCEQYCPVFPAIERRQAFDAADLAFLANLCHNCGECLYACQYAPPHPFGVDVPRTLAEVRLQSYEEYCWPSMLSRAFHRQGVWTSAGLAILSVTAVFAVTLRLNPSALDARTDAAFYVVLPHAAMVTLFGSVGLLVLLALAIALRRYWQAIAHDDTRATWRVWWRALREGVTLRHLHVAPDPCVSAEESRTPWRRYWHHATLGGFGLCLASTSVAALYHSMLGWEAPYAYGSVPVVLGTVGGVGLTVGPIGQWWARRRRDVALSDPSQAGLDEGFLLLLWLTSVTGLLLLVLRTQQLMAVLLLVHLGVVLALFLTLPYGKFVHGLYRLLALVRDHVEQQTSR